ncbi:MAG: hypothetical protein HOH50_05725 [Planctomycetaceae bacterium]|nr:hypothetical protein [Planctomycetaceae bacterium]
MIFLGDTMDLDLDRIWKYPSLELLKCDRLLSFYEVGDIVGLEPETILEWTADGTLTRVKDDDGLDAIDSEELAWLFYKSTDGPHVPPGTDPSEQSWPFGVVGPNE